MARRTVRVGLTAGVLALALIASACGDSGSNSSSSSNTQGGGSETNNSLQGTDCGTLKYDKSAPTGGTFTDYAQLSDAGSNTSFDPGVVQTLDESQITSAVWDGLTDFDFTDKCNPDAQGPSWPRSGRPTRTPPQFTFDIKKGEKFSNGDPVLPSSFKLGWERDGLAGARLPVRLPDRLHQGWRRPAGRHGQDHARRHQGRRHGHDADGRRSSQPNADFPSIVSMQEWSPIDKAEFDKVGNTDRLGQGHHHRQRSVQDREGDRPDEVVLVPNPNWAGDVYGDTKVAPVKITFKITRTSARPTRPSQSGEGDDRHDPARSVPGRPWRSTRTRSSRPDARLVLLRLRVQRPAARR